MAIQPQQNVIELSDFTQGWVPDLEREAVEQRGLVDVMNLIPDVGTATPQTRPGFERIMPALLDGNDNEIQGYVIEAIHPYNYHHAVKENDTTYTQFSDQTNYLIVVMTNRVDLQEDNWKSAETYKVEVRTRYRRGRCHGRGRGERPSTAVWKTLRNGFSTPPTPVLVRLTPSPSRAPDWS